MSAQASNPDLGDRAIALFAMPTLRVEDAGKRRDASQHGAGIDVTTVELCR
jgi:hypothetical protein